MPKVVETVKASLAKIQINLLIPTKLWQSGQPSKAEFWEAKLKIFCFWT